MPSVNDLRAGAQQIAQARFAITCLYVHGLLGEVAYARLSRRFATWAHDKGEAAFAHMKRDPRDVFVRVGAFGKGRDSTEHVTFRPCDAAEQTQGNGDPRPDYTVRIRAPSKRKRAA